jgi:hypothetical protein
MADEPVYVTLSPEVADALSASNVDLEKRIKEQLKADGINGSVKWSKNPTATEPDRELVLTILAAGVAVSLLGTSVAKVIDAVSRGRHAKITERELTPALDGSGKPILDRAGNPVYNVVEKPGAAPVSGSSRARVKAGTLLEFELSDGRSAG